MDKNDDNILNMNLAGGRPTKFNTARIKSILTDIENHIPYKIAAQANGIAERTLYYWIHQGQKDMENLTNTQYARFLQSLRKIEANRIRILINKVLSSPKGHKGSQWVLEHVFWKYFSSNVAILDLNERIEKLEMDFLIL